MQDELIIKPGKSIKHYWKELWQYRELFLFLSWRDILVRYKQTVIGLAWSIIRPFLTMIVFTVVFGKIAKLPSNGIPYPILVYSALLPWQFFANVFQDGSNSLLNNSGMISKIYFPRLIIPSTSLIVGFVDFLISLIIFAGLIVWYRYIPPVTVFLLPIFLLLTVIPSLGASLWISALNVRYRDFKYIVPFVVQFGLYISPVGFNSSIVPDKWKLLYSLNPMVAPIDGFRWCMLGHSAPLNMTAFLLSGGVSLIILLTGIQYFRSTERKFADLI